jgi:hypothetical protein
LKKKTLRRHLLAYPREVNEKAALLALEKF